ncbi:hypothetical protein O181_003167 [Austropuccinia psidii MF-1]|uniref:Uncharacterized protein n=1 Tax=Austropuccinia psidii MF-1 TaxID=1389203 RepID=A0A9Q3GEN1_9BASI|nr:hypothetical protein [Austropuccinia psidii MF-1]
MPQAPPKKGYIHDYGRIQSVTEGQMSVNESQTDELCHYEVDNTGLLSKRSDTAKGSPFGHIYRQPEGEYHILADWSKNHMNSYQNARNFLGHPKTCKLLKGFNPFMEKRNMILLTAELREKTLYHPSKCQK